MDPFLIKVLALVAVALVLGKRAVFGPQMKFARASVAMAFAGIGSLLLATEKGDLAATVGSIFLLTGLLLAIAMLSVDCVHMVRASFRKKSG